MFIALPEIKSEITHLFYESNYYILIGYKGVSWECAHNISQNGLNHAAIVESPTGASRGPGFYTTLNFHTALEFAKYAAMLFAAQTDITLSEPVPPVGFKNIIENDKYFNKVDQFEARKRQFEDTDEWKKYGIILRIYIKNFSAMSGLRLVNQKMPLPQNWESYDYIEGIMQGGTEEEWEIKFNRHQQVYLNIKTMLHPISYFCPNIPVERIRLLQATQNEFMSRIVDQKFNHHCIEYKQAMI